MKLLKLYFTTALLLTGAAHAQCNETLISVAQQGGWFIHANDADAHTHFKKNTLKIMPADERTLWSVGSRVLAQPNSTDTEFMVVRSKNIKTSDYRPALGQFVRIIGLAKIDGAPVDGTVTLKIIRADNEITTQDRLLPASCFVSSVEHTAALPAAATPTAIGDTTKIIAFINETYIGERDSIIIVDKGRATGIAVGQRWLLIDQNNHLASAQPFGQAQVLQVFDDISILHITSAQHEAQLSTPLRYLP